VDYITRVVPPEWRGKVAATAHAPIPPVRGPFERSLQRLAVVVRTQHNAWIHLTATAGVVGLGGWLDVSRTDWCWLIVAMTLVWGAEAANTALERLADAAIPDHNPLVGDAKDAAAGAVLVAAIGAAVIGLLTLGSPLWVRLSSL